MSLKIQHSSIPKKPSIAKDSASPQKLITTTIHHLKSTSLPLTAATLPFTGHQGCTCCWWGVWNIGGKDICFDTPHCDGWSVCIHIVGRGTPVEEPPSPFALKIQQLSEERKELVKGSYRDRHFNAGSILLAFGVFESIGGGVNTWFRTGKLFPGPHLFAGAAITVLWAAAAALTPAMQKGSETARNLHITLNVINVLLFVWQIPTGWEIVLKVFEFTKWP
ncbi:uncharacterized protein Pyn_38261 [Prunus yedoensis var. nudiflora]|uniref:DUF4079 domain-containing protein n=1 Tax=Prunus yedoensis var. nudiflora TaxID=2094558 RepID=A0A314ZSR1_PRUYE|nr:uncharacterized protein Pyn_38261 [Prunus yedoensis var. nudiflora]